MFNTKQLLSLCVGAGTFVLLYSGFNYLTMSEHLTDIQRKKPLPKGVVKMPGVKPVITAEEVAKVGVDAYVEQNYVEDGLFETSKKSALSAVSFQLR